MADWWAALSTLQQVFYYVAIPFTVVLLIQVVMTIIGLGGNDADADADADADIDGDFDADMDAEADFDADIDGDFDADADMEGEFDADEPSPGVAGFRFFTVRGIVAFFCIFGWTGIAFDEAGLSVWLSIVLAVVCGLAAMAVIGLMFWAVRRLTSSGNIRYRNAVGKSAEVYIPIPAVRAGRGKVMVQVQERLVEAEAMTDDTEKIGTGVTVKVVGSIGNTLIVKR